MQLAAQASVRLGAGQVQAKQSTGQVSARRVAGQVSTRHRPVRPQPRNQPVGPQPGNQPAWAEAMQSAGQASHAVGRWGLSMAASLLAPSYLQSASLGPLLRSGSREREVVR